MALTMKFANDRMTDPVLQQERLHHLTRSDRNAWGEQQEELIRDLCPFPISYDVNANQPTNFSEYSYTEFAGGMKLCTQSIDINTRLIKQAAEESNNESYDELLEAKWKNILKDKYKLDRADTKSYPETVIFLPGNNVLDLMNWELIARVILEIDDVMIKPHPLIDEKAAEKIAHKVGWNRIINPNESGMDYLLNAKTIYSGSVSELTIVGALYDKKVINLGNFFNECLGAYYPLTRQMFLSDNPKQTILNVMNCDYSGFIFPWMSPAQVENRIVKFYNESLRLRKIYSPLYIMPPPPPPPRKNKGE